jgi:hypothetical protein
MSSGAARICHGVQIPVKVISERIGPKDRLLIIGIVGRRGEGRGQVGSQKRPAVHCPSACVLVRDLAEQA